ncbi:hypothetical protein ALP45_00595 [Pseudomonas coronafaciens pv. atropurpurea]|uniref:hypothetical protein n=1 Tax=Pseudomonas coronafaciens TaxID=53409 RepID=UPI0006E549A8|nr:hypothetical protein [Pseudomonas coronafaciens]KPW31391.1 Uncharacterized protein ALO66_02607 [Pseudomonas coronafaciens pv. atropurpurea]RMT58401.1 hypothetical protein ALP45_00595 [Pseudomonas coronafaciens pv. atropurpurea]
MDETSMASQIKHFYLKTPLDLLLKLKWGINRFNEAIQKDDPSDQFFPAVYYAFDCGITAWSMVDWAWKYHEVELKENPLFSKKGKSDFEQWVRQSSDHLRICYQLANSGKHLGIDKFADAGLVTELKSTQQHFSAGSPVGEPLMRHRYYFNVDDNGTPLQVGEVLEGAYQFWCRELQIPAIT